MKDFFEFQGNFKIMDSRDAAREAFSKNLILEGSAWLKMIESRNLTSHTYNQETANQIIHMIIKDYFILFDAFDKKMTELSLSVESTEA